MPITDWPKAERPREKLLARGPQALSDAELLAIFLRTGVAGKTAVDVARELLTQFGGLRTLLAAERTALCAAPGLGDAKYAQLMAALELGRRHLGEVLTRGAALESARDTRETPRGSGHADRPSGIRGCHGRIQAPRHVSVLRPDGGAPVRAPP